MFGVLTSGCPLQPMIFGLCSSDMMMRRFVGFIRSFGYGRYPAAFSAIVTRSRLLYLSSPMLAREGGSYEPLMGSFIISSGGGRILNDGDTQISRRRFLGGLTALG